MSSKTFVDILMDQAEANAQAFGLSLGDILINYWLVAKQYLDQHDPYATAQIQEALDQLIRHEITPELFHARISRPAVDLDTILDIHQGFLPRH